MGNKIETTKLGDKDSKSRRKSIKHKKTDCKGSIKAWDKHFTMLKKVSKNRAIVNSEGYHVVPGSARTRLIFTRIQQGTQPDGLTPLGQTEPGIPYHVPSCWVPVGGRGAGGQELIRGSGACAAVRSRRAALCCRALFFWFILCIPLFCIIVVPVPFVCCSVKLPLS